jgi:GntR family transcriptional repressor for pyruvate dehydrogenase complex
MRSYLLSFQQEHRAIVAAIESGSVEQAQSAMRSHLVNSSQRYRSLAAQRPLSRKPDPPAPA